MPLDSDTSAGARSVDARQRIEDGQGWEQASGTDARFENGRFHINATPRRDPVAVAQVSSGTRSYHARNGQSPEAGFRETPLGHSARSLLPPLALLGPAALQDL